jgi:hypothetical protein
MMTDQISDEEAMRVSEDTGIRMMQDLGFMDARGSLTELGRGLDSTRGAESGGKKAELKGGDVGRRHGESGSNVVSSLRHLRCG